MIDVTEHLGLVWKIINKYNYTPPLGMDEDDLFQTGCIGLMTAARKFNAELGYTFSTYAATWIRAELQRMYDYHGRQKRRKVPMSLDKLLDNSKSSLAEIIPDTVSIESEVIASNLKKAYSEREPIITRMLLRGYTQKEIGKELGISHQRVSIRIQNLRKMVV